eukprot:1762440-Prymnesium_polylepis.1
MAHFRPEGGHGCRTPLGSRPKLDDGPFYSTLDRPTRRRGDAGAFRATDIGSRGVACMHAISQS